MKKALAIALTLGMMLTLFACATQPAQPASSDAAAAMPNASAPAASTDLPEKVTFLTSQAKFQEHYHQAVADAIEKDLGIKIEFQVVPDNEYQALVKVKLNTSEVPDVFEYNFPTSNKDLGIAQYCEALDNEKWVSRLVNPTLIQDKDDGKIYALPRQSSSTYLAVYYNKAVLEQAGFPNAHPKTYQEFLDICEAIKQKVPDAVPFYMSNKDTWTTQIFMHGGYPVALNERAEEIQNKLLANEIKWTEVPEFKMLLNQYIDLIAKGYVNKDHLSATFDMAPEAIGTGKAGMYLSIENFVSTVNSQYPETEIGSFVIPYNDVEKLPTGQYVQGIFVPSAGKQVDKIKNFLNVWSDPKYQNVFYKAAPGFPAFDDVEGGDVPEAVKSLVDNYVATGEYLYQINDPMSEVGTLWPDLWNYYIEAITGTKTTDQVFETFQKQYEDFMKQQQMPGF